jgi:hypothetical protein
MLTRRNPKSKVVIADQRDLRIAVRNALAMSGYTFQQLEGQAKTGRFETRKARRAWVAIGDLGHLAAH